MQVSIEDFFFIGHMYLSGVLLGMDLRISIIKRRVSKRSDYIFKYNLIIYIQQSDGLGELMYSLKDPTLMQRRSNFQSKFLLMFYDTYVDESQTSKGKVYQHKMETRKTSHLRPAYLRSSQLC